MLRLLFPTAMSMKCWVLSRVWIFKKLLALMTSLLASTFTAGIPLRMILWLWSEFEKTLSCIKFLNSTTLVLLSKKENVEDITDLRSISLLNCRYKIVAKVLAARLSRYIDKLTNESQSAFILSRFILDNFMTAHECLHDQRLRPKECIMCWS